MEVLSNADQAIIDPVKLHGYLLSTSHPIGRFKAAFFARLGYTSINWQALDRALREQHPYEGRQTHGNDSARAEIRDSRYSEGTKRGIGRRPDSMDDPD